MFFLSLLLLNAKADTETFRKEFDKVKSLTLIDIEELNFNSYPRGHYMVTTNGFEKELEFTEFAILEVSGSNCVLTIEGPVYVISIGDNNQFNARSIGYLTPFVESAGSLVKINSDRYSNKPSCKLPFTSLYYHENYKDIKTSFENFDTEYYVPGNLYYICGFQDVDLQKLNPNWKEIGSQTRVLFNLGAPGQFCRGDHQPHDAGTELYSHSVDSIVKSEAKMLPQVGDGEKRRILLPKGHYQIFVGDCDLSIESTDLAYIEIFATSEKKHFKADVQGPVIVGGETTTADFTTTLDFQTKLFPFFQIKGNSFTLKVSHLGESEEPYRFMFGKTDRSIWKIETQSGMGTFYGSEASSSSGCVLKFEDVSFPYIIGQSEWDSTIFGKTTDSSAKTNVLGIVLGCVFGFIALAAIIAGIVVAVICIRKKKNNNNGGNEV